MLDKNMKSESYVQSLDSDILTERGFFEWNIPDNKIIICEYLAGIAAFKTKNSIQTYTEWCDITHPDDSFHTQIALEKIQKKQTLYVVTETRKMCRDGTWCWFKVQGKVIQHDVDGNPIRAVGTVTNISDIKETTYKLNQTKKLLNIVKNIRKKKKKKNLDDENYTEILNSFKEITYSNNVTLVFSSKSNPNKLSDEIFHSHSDTAIPRDLSYEKRDVIKTVFDTKDYIIKNGKETFLLAIHLDLPFHQQGSIVLERDHPFDIKDLDFLAPLIDATEHVISICKLKINNQELDNIISFFIKQVPAPVAMFDVDMCHKFVSDAWKIAFDLGEDPSTYIGKSHYDVYRNQPSDWRNRHERALAGEVLISEPEKVVGLYKDPIWLEGFIHPWYNLDGSIGGIIIYSNAVTKSMENEKKLTLTVDNLLRSNQALERFAHVCSHDLKEPLRSISNFIHLMFGRNVENFDDESLLYMRYILKGIDRMNTLIKDILSYSKIVGQITYEKIPIDTNNIIREIKESIDFQLSEIGAQLNTHDLPVIYGEPTQIHQVFLNLINNAIKFRSEIPLIIDVFAISKNQFYEFHVCDNGIGIEKEYYKSIFTMFKRLHTKNEFEGSGIGLATCQKIINDHGGEIWTKSNPGHGSNFVFTLPV